MTTPQPIFLTGEPARARMVITDKGMKVVDEDEPTTETTESTCCKDAECKEKD